MAYKTKNLRKQAKKAIVDKKLIFIADVIAHIPCAKPTFYEHFPDGSNDLKDFKEMIDKNRIDLKISMRSKWYKGSNPTLQMGLYKLLSTDQERKALSMEYKKHSGEVKILKWDEEEGDPAEYIQQTLNR